MNIYNLDTSVLLDYYEKRGKNGEDALNLILRIIQEDSKIILSDLHINEFKNLGYNLNQINDIFSIAKPNNILRVHLHKAQLAEAHKIALEKEVPKKDALHAILARDNFAIMVSKDRHFGKLKHLTETKKPEEVY